jgi:hypothetical protein
VIVLGVKDRLAGPPSSAFLVFTHDDEVERERIIFITHLKPVCHDDEALFV